MPKGAITKRPGPFSVMRRPSRKTTPRSYSLAILIVDLAKAKSSRATNATPPTRIIDSAPWSGATFGATCIPGMVHIPRPIPSGALPSERYADPTEASCSKLEFVQQSDVLGALGAREDAVHLRGRARCAVHFARHVTNGPSPKGPARISLSANGPASASEFATWRVTSVRGPRDAYDTPDQSTTALAARIAAQARS